MRNRFKNGAASTRRNSITKCDTSLCERLERRSLLSSVVVNTTADVIDAPGSPTVSLRDAFKLAGSQQSDNVVDISFDPKVFATAKTINLSLGSLKEVGQTSQSQVDTIQITGPAAGVTISGQYKSAVFDLEDLITAKFSNLTVKDSTGYGIYLLGPNPGSLDYSLTNVTVTACDSAGVWTGDNADENESISATNCSITNNLGDGVVAPYCELNNCTISGNAWGINLGTGGAQGLGSFAKISNTTISGNKKGGIIADVVNATNCTISGNGGYAIQYNNFVGPYSPPTKADGTLTNLTIAGNAGGINTSSIPEAGSSMQDNPGPYVSLGNCIVAGNTTASIHTDVTGPVFSLGHNLIGVASGKNNYNGSGGWISSDLVGSSSKPENPQLSALGNYGGPTLTMLPAANSPVVNAGSNALIPSGVTADQRGNPRIFGGTVDIGAVEVRYCTITGEVFNDANHNGVLNPGEKPLAGQKVFLDLNNNGKPDSGEPIVTTGSNGAFSFSFIPAGTYRIKWIETPGFRVVAPTGGTRTITVATGQTLANEDFAINVLSKRTGTTIGTTGSNGNTAAKATDGNLTTFFDANSANGNWVGLNLGSNEPVSQIAFAPRSGYTNRMIGGKFQYSTSANFTTGVTTLYTISSAPVAGSLTILDLGTATTARYFRYLSPNGSHGDIAEFQIFG